VSAEGKVEARPIVASYRSGNEWVVEKGLDAGERVVVEGIGKVRPGALVKAVALPVPVAPARPNTAASADSLARVTR